MFVRRKVFISYHHEDQIEVDSFIRTFDIYGDLFISRGLGVEMSSDVIDSTDPEYVMKRIRELYLADSTVTLVLIGRCTWSRRYVDWEIQSSLRSGEKTTPNGLLGVVLPSAGQHPAAPNRLQLNLEIPNARAGYASWYWYPGTPEALLNCIESAYQARSSKAHLIVNPREKMQYNRSCTR